MYNMTAVEVDSVCMASFFCPTSYQNHTCFIQWTNFDFGLWSGYIGSSQISTPEVQGLDRTFNLDKVKCRDNPTRFWINPFQPCLWEWNHGVFSHSASTSTGGHKAICQADSEAPKLTIGCHYQHQLTTLSHWVPKDNVYVGGNASLTVGHPYSNLHSHPTGTCYA